MKSLSLGPRDSTLPSKQIPEVRSPAALTISNTMMALSEKLDVYVEEQWWVFLYKKRSKPYILCMGDINKTQSCK